MSSSNSDDDAASAPPVKRAKKGSHKNKLGIMANINTKTPAMVLQEVATKKCFAPPTYEIIYSITGTHENRFDYRVTVGGIVATGSGPSKQVSKHEAAYNALMKLKDIGIYDPSENPVQEFNAPLQSPPESPLSPFKAPNCIGPLKDLCMEHKIPEPVFTMISDVGPPHSRKFTYECSVASMKTIATENTKKMAKQIAAKDMLERIKDVIPDIAKECVVKEDQKAISDGVNKAVQIYNEFFANIIPDKTVKADDYSGTLRKIMTEYDLTFEHFQKNFSDRTEESLKLILNQLGLTYNIYSMQVDPYLVSVSLSTDTPFTTIGMSKVSEKEALTDAIKSTFEIMEGFMK